jgi:ubiquinone/menaquinone biosynthesis C-methylase UbiE
LLDMIEWRGDETVLDLGCGRGLLVNGAARRLVSGRAVGIDLWLPQAMTGNRGEAALSNAALEGVRDRVAVLKADARRLPFESGSFDVAISNFLLHELKTPDAREEVLREMTRVLRPGGQLALIDFIFTKECVATLARAGLPDARRLRLGGLSHWIGAALMLGTFQLCAVRATRPGSPER